MKKITEIAVRAFNYRTNVKLSNTSVTNNDGVTKMFLHGNRIAMLNDGVLTLSSCGWTTNTTKERLNGILSTFDKRAGIYQKDWKWYIYIGNTTVPFSDGLKIDWTKETFITNEEV